MLQDSDKEQQLAQHCEDILRLLGEDPSREGLVRTPHRVARTWTELTRGYNEDPVAILRSALFQETYHNMVVIRDIEFYSLCEHHLLPFFGHVHLAYIPNGEIAGLSKFARIVDSFSHRLQVQERMTEEIAHCIEQALHPQGVMVVVEARHLCMQMRGVAKQGAYTTTMHHIGAFEHAELRQEFLSRLHLQ